MKLDEAKTALASRYRVEPEYLEFFTTWRIPEIGKEYLMFHITDPAHIQYGSTVCQCTTSLDKLFPAAGVVDNPVPGR